MTYSLLLNSLDGLPAHGVKRDADDAFIPADPANADWRAYESWRAGGHEPRPAPAPPANTPDLALWQARVVLARHGLLEAANAAVAASGNAALQTLWDYGNSLSRQSPGLAALARALGLTPAALDALFMEAAGISV